MANANIEAGSHRLKVALRNLRDHWNEVEPTWSDAPRRRFEDRYLLPLDPAADAATLGMRKLAEVLDRVRRDLTDRSEAP